MRLFACLIVLSFTGFSPSAEPKVIASGQQGERPLKFAGGLATQYEGLVISVLGSCSVEGETTKEKWENSLKGDHLRIQFSQARTFAMDIEKKEVEAEEIIVPISERALPTQILVRNGKSYRAFAKHDPKICFFIQDRLKELLSAK